MFQPLEVINFTDVSGFIVNLIAALAILLFGLIAGNLLGKLTKKFLHSFEIDDVLGKQGFKFPIEKFIASIVKYIVYFMGIVWALSQLGLATTVLQAILVVVLILIIAIIILAFKDFIPNITAGFFIFQKKEIQPGDYIYVDNVEGKVIEIDLVETKLKAKGGDVLLVPNTVLLKNEVRKKETKKKKK